MRIKNSRDFYAGLLFTLFGATFALGATQYRMGTAARMGPGFFPSILGGLLTALGLIIFLRSLVYESAEARLGRLILRPAVLSFAAIAAFALLLKAAGLVFAIFAIIVVASLAGQEWRFKESLISAGVLCAVSLAIFVYGLNLQIPVWPPFIGR